MERERAEHKCATDAPACVHCAAHGPQPRCLPSPQVLDVSSNFLQSLPIADLKMMLKPPTTDGTGPRLVSVECHGNPNLLRPPREIAEQVHALEPRDSAALNLCSCSCEPASHDGVLPRFAGASGAALRGTQCETHCVVRIGAIQEAMGGCCKRRCNAMCGALV